MGRCFGIGGAYLITIGIISFFATIVALVECIAGNAAFIDFVIYLILTAVLNIYTVKRCMALGNPGRIPVMLIDAWMIAFAFVWKLLFAVLTHSTIPGKKSSDDQNGGCKDYDLKRMPSVIYDDNDERWERVDYQSEGTEAVYRNRDGEDIRLYHTDITGNFAMTSAGNFHW